MPNLNADIIRRLEIPLPPLATQRAIAHILGALDDKIELNRKTNETLEAMARALFQSWFVDFDPVRAKAAGRAPDGMDEATAKLFPSEFEQSELGEVPKGWIWTKLKSVAELNPSRALSRGIVAPYVEMSNLPTSGHQPLEWPRREFGSGTRFVNGDTLLARISPCLENGKTGYVDFLEEGQIGWGSTEYIVIRPCPPLPSEWGYLLARDSQFRLFAAKKMEGTTGRQRVAAASVGEYRLVLPTAQVSRRFGEWLRSAFGCLSAACDESRTLAALRDALLPKLLSGELAIRDAETFVSRAV
jgi:type I restriction enzyme S subunit